MTTGRDNATSCGDANTSYPFVVRVPRGFKKWQTFFFEATLAALLHFAAAGDKDDRLKTSHPVTM
ncbi:MAG TPA: hypothetical protein VLK78_00635 [Candidatus Angelobacter sp.]|nr:hypothetical protein [Candidatus Angelobacter sp.]